jgi:hypothetical protein
MDDDGDFGALVFSAIWLALYTDSVQFRHLPEDLERTRCETTFVDAQWVLAWM